MNSFAPLTPSPPQRASRLPPLPDRIAIWETLEKRRLERARLHAVEAAQTFEGFVRITTPGYLWGWFHRDVCRELMDFLLAVERGERPRLMLSAPPRHGKTELVSRKFPAYVLGRHPDWPIIATSYASDLASSINRDVQRNIDDPAYRIIFPGTRLAGSGSKGWIRTSDLFEVVGRKGSYRSAGVGGGITGMGGRILLMDDPIKDAKEADSEATRNSIWDWYQSTFYPRQEGATGILLIMTRWHTDDPAGRLLEAMKAGADQWRVVNYPAIAEEDDEHRVKGEPLNPERHPLEQLEATKIVVGAYRWNALFQGRPQAREGGTFRPDAMPIALARPHDTVPVRWVRAWDLASKKKASSDWTAGMLMGRLPDDRFLIADVQRFRGTPDEVEARIVYTAAIDGRGVEISLPNDPGQAGEFQVQYLTGKLAGHHVTSSPETGSKTTRADPFAAQVNVGNVSMLKGDWNYGLTEEMRNFPTGTYDDQIDAGSRAFMVLAEGFNLAEFMKAWA